MQPQKKRTLGRRIQWTIKGSILTALLGITLMVSVLATVAERMESETFCSMVANLLADRADASELRHQMGDILLTNVKAGSPEADILIERFRSFENLQLKSYLKSGDIHHAITYRADISNLYIEDSENFTAHPISSEVYRVGDFIHLSVLLRGEPFYNSDGMKDDLHSSTAKPSLFRRLVTVQSVCHIQDDSGTNILTIRVQMDPKVLTQYFVWLYIGLASMALLLLLLSNFFSSHLVRTVSRPFSVLAERLKALANEDYETTMNAQLVVKRPLSEIRSLAQSTNAILDRIRSLSDHHLQLNQQMERVNYELEAQNEELIESRHRIEDAQALLVQSQNLASIGQLTAAITHEINTPIGTISSNVQMQEMLVSQLAANRTIQESENLRELTLQLEDAGKLNSLACERVIAIIKSLKNFSRLDQSELQPANINEHMQSVVLLTSNLWKRRLQIVEEYGDIPLVVCYPGLINQVLMNIFVNAIHAIPATGEIHVSSFCDGDWVHITIQDNGVGIPEHLLTRIFESGFTTKELGKGSGLGLAICQSIVKKHNGRLSVESTPGIGSVFTVILPVKGPSQVDV